MSESTSDHQKWQPPPAGSPCWIEIPAVDVPACKRFYAGVFPLWEFRPATEEHTEHKMARWNFAGLPGLSGGIRRPAAEQDKPTPEGSRAGHIVFYFVESIDDTQKRVEELGGTTVGEKENESGTGMYIYFKDVAGNKFGVYELKK